MKISALRLFTIAAISFLTLVDLFATQSILPTLARAYGVAPSVIGPIVNACTFGMAIAGFAVAWFNRRINRRLGVSLCLALLAIPTFILSFMPGLMTIAALRIVQGLFMSAAFSLTIAYLSENLSADEAASALAAYVTGNVASNLFGRLISAAIADSFGLGANFQFFAALNLFGAALAYVSLKSMPRSESSQANVEASWSGIFHRSDLVSCFAIGFLILFTFIGIFTYVNFVLTGPIGLSTMQLGFVYLVFLPSIITTPAAGGIAQRFGSRQTIMTALALAGIGLALLAAQNLTTVLAGLALVAVGTFFAQATATGYVSRASGPARGAAGGIYLSFYYAGGLAGSIVLGRVFDGLGWDATLLTVAAAFIAAALLATRLQDATMAHSTAILKQ